jgi:hypothetical protein
VRRRKEEGSLWSHYPHLLPAFHPPPSPHSPLLSLHLPPLWVRQGLLLLLLSCGALVGGLRVRGRGGRGLGRCLQAPWIVLLSFPPPSALLATACVTVLMDTRFSALLFELLRCPLCFVLCVCMLFCG